MSGRLIVVSNRLPMTLRRVGDQWTSEPSPGGLASAMKPLLRKHGGDWIGWAGDYDADESSEQRRNTLNEWAKGEKLFAVKLSSAVAHGFYDGYSNQTLWPVFHSFLTRLKFNADQWDAYVSANKAFCEAAIEHYQVGDSLWIHDYQLMLVPQMVRAALPDARIGFFLHTPFPAADIFSILPRREELLEGLLGADLIAFHTHGYLQHFRASLLRVLGMESRIAEVLSGSRSVRLSALPIGIAAGEYAGLLSTDEAAIKHRADWTVRYGDKRVLLAVDRMDYIKGIPERLYAYAHLLRSSPEFRGQIVLIQIAVPTRESIGSYQELRTEVNRLIGDINGKFGTPDWTPIVYINRSIERSELVALYSLAEVCWVGSLRDGMNLVAKEYIACKPRGDGVLVLSEFAGAAAEMGEALLINPFDEERTAGTMKRALTLENREKHQRMQTLRNRVLRNDVFRWGELFLGSLQEAIAVRGSYEDGQPKLLDFGEIEKAYANATQRLIMLDYDGTLVPFFKYPREASPPPEVLGLLTDLAADAHNFLVLISGRSNEELAQWFGLIHGIWLVAEHGAEIKSPTSSSWEAFRPEAPTDWKSNVRPILEHFADRTPGSFFEEKKYSLVWHFRSVEQEFASWLAHELASILEGMLAETDLTAFRGDKIIEVKPVWANKGTAFKHILEKYPSPDFIFAAGDDRTDEDLFDGLPRNAWTLHVGSSSTHAKFLVPDFVAIRKLLRAFADTPVRTPQKR